MEENVALDSNKQKQFVKSIKGIKKFIQNNVAKSTEEVSGDAEVNEKTKTGRIRKRKPKQRGLVYLGHIPHGFYEGEMRQYFSQFGAVMGARVARSARSGRAKGYGFVEFAQPAVAQIVADTMNNYLMGKRLIKAVYIPPEKQKRAFRKRWSATNNPGNSLRIKMKKAYNADKDEKGELSKARKLLSNLAKTKKKLSELGIDYEFFSPVDAPAARTPPPAAGQAAGPAAKKEKSPAKSMDMNKKQKYDSSTPGELEPSQRTRPSKKKKPSDSQNERVNGQRKPKRRHSKAEGAEARGDFVKIRESADDDDGSDEFDSDEFERVMADEDGSDGDHDSEQELPPKKVHVKSAGAAPRKRAPRAHHSEAAAAPRAATTSRSKPTGRRANSSKKLNKLL